MHVEVCLNRRNSRHKSSEDTPKMTEEAYVLIETQVGKTKDVVEAIRGVAGVITVDVVTSPYDVIAVVEVEDFTEMGNIVTAKIAHIPDVGR